MDRLIISIKVFFICFLYSCTIGSNASEFSMVEALCSSNLKDINTFIHDINLSAEMTELPFSNEGFLIDSSVVNIKASLNYKYSISHFFPSFELMSFGKFSHDTISVMGTNIEYKNNAFHTPAIAKAYLVHSYNKDYIFLQVIDLTSRSNTYCDYVIFKLETGEKAIFLGIYFGLNVRPIIRGYDDDKKIYFYLINREKVSILAIGDNEIASRGEIPVNLDLDFNTESILIKEIIPKEQIRSHFESKDTCRIKFVSYHYEDAYR